MDGTKVVMVTGASSGIGQGICEVFAERGWDVAFTYGKNEDGAKETARRVEALGRRCTYYQASMEDIEAPARVVNQARRDHGRIDAMICNANRDRRNSVLTLTPEVVSNMMTVNFASYVLSAGAAARWMVRDKIEGTIVFVTSTHSMRAYADDVMYGGLKAGIMRACESMALDLSPYRIRVNCIAPGATRVRAARNVGMANSFERVVPLGRMGTPRDNGELAYFLCSDAGSYITGTSIKLDGGLILAGQPEGWAPAYEINPDFTQKHYEAMKADFAYEEENDHD